MNKASGGDGIPLELFQILKDDVVKVLPQYASKFGKLSSVESETPILWPPDAKN